MNIVMDRYEYRVIYMNRVIDVRCLLERVRPLL